MIVLVVDDEKDVELLFRQRFRKEIRNNQVDFHFAFSGEEAVAYLDSNGTTELVLILSDINMPGMNGLELLRIIKTKFPDAPKVMMITAYDDERNRIEAEKYGCDGYLTKPVDFKALREKILSM